MALARRCGGSARLHDTVTVGGEGTRPVFSFPTDADTNKGPMAKSGFGCEAMNT
jgi:hypothetical protein